MEIMISVKLTKHILKKIEIIKKQMKLILMILKKKSMMI